eukprot:5540312-Amphidinium_carterae.1
MLGAVTLGRLDAYMSFIKQYATRYNLWAKVYEADMKCRSEHMVRLRRDLEEQRARAQANGRAHDYDPSKPWEAVWAAAIIDTAFWRKELEEPALVLLS